MERAGPPAGKRFRVGDRLIAFGRHRDNSVLIFSGSASRLHTEMVRDVHQPKDRGLLLSDPANAIHFQPGRGLNSVLVSAVSPARALEGARSASVPQP